MKYYAVFATVTRRHAADLAAALNHEIGADYAKVARPERGKLKKPFRYLVISPIPQHTQYARRIQDSVRPPRHPRLQLAREWCADILIAAIETLTRAVRALKGKHHAK